MGSLGLPRATRFETTTKFTGRSLLFIPPRLTAVHQYGSGPPFLRNETKIGRARWNQFRKWNWFSAVKTAVRNWSAQTLTELAATALWS
jgi:hypothetical protein